MASAKTVRTAVGSDFNSKKLFAGRRLAHAAAMTLECLERRELLTTVAGDFTWLTGPQSLKFDFDTNVEPEFSIADFTIDNLTSNTSISAADLALSYDAAAGDIATVTWPTYSGGAPGVLSDGNYEAIISAGSVPGLSGDYSFGPGANQNFWFLNADGNRDKSVNLADHSLLAANFGQSGRNFGQGDYNYDGQVNLLDMNILASRFGAHLQDAPNTPNTANIGVATTRSITVQWSAPASGTWDGFRVYRSGDGVNFTLIGTVAADERGYVDDAAGRGLKDGTKYWYRVRSFTNAAGNSTVTNKVAGITGILPPENIRAAGKGAGWIDLAWDDRSSSETATHVYMSADGGAYQEVTPVPGANETSKRIEGLKPETVYSFKLKTSNADRDSAETLPLHVKTASAIVGPATGQEGQPLRYSADPTATSGSPLRYFWNVLKSGETFASGNASDFEFTPDDDARYTVSLTITGGSQGPVSSIMDVIVANSAPASVSIVGPTVIRQGHVITLTAVAADAAPGDRELRHSWSLEYSDGTDVTLPSSLRTDLKSFSYAPPNESNNRDYIATVTVTDDGGISSTASHYFRSVTAAPAGV